MEVCEEMTWAGGRGVAIAGAVNEETSSNSVFCSYNLEVVNKCIPQFKPCL
jgi:hypothetical protein